MTELPTFLIHFLSKSMNWAMSAPEIGQTPGTGIHCYLGKVEVICEGELIGHLVNDDPEWVYRPAVSA